MMSEERFNELKALGFFRDEETHAKDAKHYRVEKVDGETYVLDMRSYKGSYPQRDVLKEVIKGNSI